MLPRAIPNYKTGLRTRIRCFLLEMSVMWKWGTERKGFVGGLNCGKRWGWESLCFSKGEKCGVSRALMFPRQETPSPSYAFYLSTRSPIFIRLYLRLESVPLHFLLKSLSTYLPHLLPPPIHRPQTEVSPYRPLGADVVTTTCKHSGICNSNAVKRVRDTWVAVEACGCPQLLQEEDASTVLPHR